MNTTIPVYNCYLLSTLLYGIGNRTPFACPKHSLYSLHLSCLQCLMCVSWRDWVANAEVLKQASTSSMFVISSQRFFRQLGHVHRMEDGRHPLAVPYGDLAAAARHCACPLLHFNDVSKRDRMSANIDTGKREGVLGNRSNWQTTNRTGPQLAEDKRNQRWWEWRARHRERTASSPPVTFTADIATETVTPKLDSSTTTDAVHGEADVTTWVQFHCLLRQKVINEERGGREQYPVISSTDDGGQIHLNVVAVL